MERQSRMDRPIVVRKGISFKSCSWLTLDFSLLTKTTSKQNDTIIKALAMRGTREGQTYSESTICNLALAFYDAMRPYMLLKLKCNNCVLYPKLSLSRIILYIDKFAKGR